MVGVYKIYPNKKRNVLASLSINNILIFLNVILFIALTLFGFFRSHVCSETICRYIALQPNSILQGEYIWTFITSMFMHGGFFHLFVNMLSLFFVGSLIEKIIGRKRYLNFYLISGLFAGLFFVLASFIFTKDLNAYAVGASGALFGLIGLLMLLAPNLRVYVMFIPIPIRLKYAAPGMLIVLWLISIAGNVPIGNTAHLGGLIAGLAYGLYLMKAYPNKIKFIRKRFS